MIIDTHCHLIDDAFKGEENAIINNALQAGVNKMILACCDIQEYFQIQELCASHPGTLYPTLGIHPENLHDDIQEQIVQFDKVLKENHDSIVAIGEIGLDLHWDKTRLEEQKQILFHQIYQAVEYDLPVLLHVRDAMPEFLEMLHIIYNNIEPLGLKLRGILHCYSGTIEEAEEAMTMGEFLLGIGGTVTYKKSDRIEIARHFELEKIVLETDAPYLAPVPHRGKRNEPAYTRDVAEFIAKSLDCTFDQVCEKTTANAEKLFCLR